MIPFKWPSVINDFRGFPWRLDRSAQCYRHEARVVPLEAMESYLCGYRKGPLHLQHYKKALNYHIVNSPADLQPKESIPVYIKITLAPIPPTDPDPCDKDAEPDRPFTIAEVLDGLARLHEFIDEQGIFEVSSESVQLT